MNTKVYSPRDFPSYLPKLNALYDDLFTGGKGFRSFLTQKVAIPLGLDESTILLLCQTIEFIHNASLLHDDLIDKAHLRRGKTTAWLKYTPEYAVLAGDYLLARVMCNLSEYGNIELVQLTSQAIGELLEGEWMQDSLVGDFNISFDQLTEVHNLKTATLFRWCLVAPLVAKKIEDDSVREALKEMGTILGLLFQRSDDLLDYDVRNYEHKAVLGDLKSGYLNSFAAFLTSDWSGDARRSLQSVVDMEHFHRVVGKDVFDQKLSQFDELNIEFIDRYNHHLRHLESKGVLLGQRDLVKNLSGLAELLYWRKKPGGEPS